MKTKVYSLFDVKAAVYGTPFFMQNDSMATRSFADLVNDKQTMVNRHPEDFTLHGVGQFDDDKGLLEGMTPWIVATAASLVKEPRSRQLTFSDALNNGEVEEAVR